MTPRSRPGRTLLFALTFIGCMAEGYLLLTGQPPYAPVVLLLVAANAYFFTSATTDSLTEGRAR